MANKRIEQLQEITAVELSNNDLLLVADTEYVESKKLKIGQLESFLLSSGNFTSGAFYGTASWAINAKTASYISTQLSSSYAKTSSWSINALNAVDAISASYSKSGSYCLTSSYIISASYARTSSVQLAYSSAYSSYANTASYILYTARPNGTASFAITSSNARTASFAMSASYAPIPASASFASRSIQAVYATSSLTSSFLYYQSGINNGTASYAITSKSPPNVRINYGIFDGIVQSSTGSVIDSIVINSSVDGNYSSSINAVGSYETPLSGGASGGISLISLDKWSGISQTLDTTPIYLTNGDDIVPFMLSGEGPMSSSQYLYVIATGGITLNASRNVKFNITSMADSVFYSAGESIGFNTYPTAAIMTYTSSNYPGTVRTGNYTNMISDGITTITEINAINTGLTQIKYLWTLNNLTKFKCSNNQYLRDISGLPPSLTELYCGNCMLTKIASLTNTSLTRLECYGNQLTILPTIPATVTYINCVSNTSMTTLTSLPNGLLALYADYTAITLPNSLPTSLVTMSLSNNTNISTLPSVLPTGLLYVDVSNCNITQASLQNLTTTLVNNGLSNGVLIINGNQGYTVTTLANIATLTGIGRTWTVTS